MALLTFAGIPAAQHADAHPKRPGQQPPNIVLIHLDDMGYGDLTATGATGYRTPNIDRLCAEGMRFTNYYSAQAVSSASRAGLLTGCYPNRIGFAGALGPKSKTGLNPDEETMAENLKKAGYATAIVGKWHVGCRPGLMPLDHGFDEYFGLPYSNDMWPHHPQTSSYPPLPLYEGRKVVNPSVSAADQAQLTTRYTEHAVDFITRRSEGPFFLYLAYDAPHEPYVIDDTSWYDDRSDWTMNTKRYASLITHMDKAIGRLLSHLDSIGLRENTMVIFASDNGAAVQAPLKELGCNAGFNGRKGMLYEGGIRVPFIVNQPGKVPVQKLDNIIYFPDVMPTLAALAGGEASLPQGIDGMNILPLFYGRQVDTDNRLLYWEFPGKQRAARRGDWKCVTVKKNKPLELYNLKDDPGERHNLAAEHPDMVERFDREMKAMHHPSPNWPLEGETLPAGGL